MPTMNNIYWTMSPIARSYGYACIINDGPFERDTANLGGYNPMMVCPYDDSRLLLILQIDHSRIAGWIAAHWGNDRFARLCPYASMVLAAQEHDSGWWEWEIKPSVNEQGYPSDYIGSIKHLGQGVWLDLYRGVIERLASRDPYAAYFVSMHGEALLSQGMGLLPSMPDYRNDPAVQNFIAEQKVPRG